MELVNTGYYYYPALISGIELVTSNASGTATPTADVELSVDNGTTWSLLAAGVAMDRFGKGQYTWTPAGEAERR